MPEVLEIWNESLLTSILYALAASKTLTVGDDLHIKHVLSLIFGS